MADPDGEVLTGPKLPRWVLPLLITLGVLLVVGLVVVQVRRGDPSESGAPTPVPTTSPATSRDAPTTPVLPSEVVRRPSRFVPAPLPLHAPIDSIATDGESVWTLARGQLVHGFGAGADPVRVPGAVGGQVLVDPVGKIVWVVGRGARPTITSFEMSPVRPIRTEHWPRPIGGVAALDSALTIVDGAGVSRVSLTGDVSVLARASIGRVLGVAPDAAGDRVVVLGPDDIVAIGADGKQTHGRPPEEMTQGSMAVTGVGRPWLGARGLSGVWLVRVDTATLALTRLASASSLAGTSGPVSIAAGNEDVLFADASGQVRCVDGVYGRTRQFWDLHARQVVLLGSQAYAVTDDGLVQLVLDECEG